MSREKNDRIEGKGRLVPALATGVEYKVEFGIDSPPAPLKFGGGQRSATWTTCFIRPAHARVIPDGSYFLHAEDGRVHQLRAVGGKWRCLALAA